MKKFVGGLFLIIVILLFIGQIGWYSVGISTPDEPIEVLPGNWVAKILPVDETYEEAIEARLDLRHLSGPPVDVYVLDKDNFNLFENEGKGVAAAGGDKVEFLGWIVTNENFNSVNGNLKYIKFNNQVKTDWIPIGSHNTLYLVLSSRDANRSANLKAILTVRDD